MQQTNLPMESVLYQVAEWFYFVKIEVLIGFIALALVIFQKQQYRQRLAASYQELPLAIMVIDQQTHRLQLHNQLAKQLLGTRQVGKNVFFPSTSANASFFSSLDEIQSRKFHHFSKKWYTSDSRYVEIDFSGQKITYNNRQAWLVYAVQHHDSGSETEQIKASLDTTRTVLDSLSELIYIKDKQGDVVDSNSAYNNFWQGRQEEAKVKIEGILRGRQSQRRWTTDPQGRGRLLETTESILLSREGDIIGSLGISHDVTDWYRMQQDLRDEMDKRKGTELALAQRDIILQSLMESSPDAIALYNENKVYEACNQAFADSLGVEDYKSLVGKRVEEVLPEKLLNAFQETDSRVMNEDISLRYRDKNVGEDGQPRWFDVVKSPYKDPATGFKGVLLMARDVTDSYQTEMQLEEMNRELERLSFLDGLTQIANRRRFDEQLEIVWNLHRRQGMPLTVMLCDIDFFKDYNDNYGHQQGDATLKLVAKAFQNVLTRSSDCVARYGGEEFAFIIPGTDHNGAQVIAHNIHNVVKELNIEHRYSHVSDRITLSIGVASIRPSGNDTRKHLVELADQALYTAKNQGRNQTRYHQEDR